MRKIVRVDYTCVIFYALLSFTSGRSYFVSNDYVVRSFLKSMPPFVDITREAKPQTSILDFFEMFNVKVHNLSATTAIFRQKTSRTRASRDL